MLFYAGDAFTSSASALSINAAGEASFYNGSGGTVRILVDVFGYYSNAQNAAAGLRFVPLKQARIVDTRSAVGVPTTTPVAANGTITVAAAGRGGLPAASAISAAVLHVTALAPAAGGYWMTYAGGATRPSLANAFFTAGRSKTNSSITKLSTDGRLSVFNGSGGTAHYLVDVVGYFTPAMSIAAPTMRVSAVTPFRALDTGPTLIAAGATATVKVGGKGGIPASGLAAAAIHVIGAGAGTSGELITHPPGTTRSTAVTDVVFPASRYTFSLVWARVDGTGSANIFNGTNSAIRIFVDVQAYMMAPLPADAPTAVVATPGDRSATVSWTAPTSTGDLPIAGYEVTAAPGGQRVTSTGTTMSVAGLSNDIEYTFTVRAQNGAGYSPASAPSDPITPTAPKPPGKPFITDVTARDTEIGISWSAPPTGPKSVATYRVVADPGGSTVTVPGSKLDATLTGLANGQPYTVRVIAVNLSGEQASDPSEVVKPVPGSPPLPPIISKVTALDGRVDLQWLPAADGGSKLLGYAVDVSPGGQHVDVQPDTTVASVTGLTNGTEYTFTLTALNAAGVSDARTHKSTPLASRPPAPPVGVRAAPSASGSVALQWEAPSDIGTSPISGYTVQASPGGQTVTSATTSATVTGLDPALTYSFTVKANNSAGSSAGSTPTGPITPALALATQPVVLSAAAMSTLRYAHADGTLTFDSPPAEVRNLQVGTIIVVPDSAKTPRGMLARVSRVDVQTGLTTVATTEAALDDVFTDGALAAQIVPHDDDITEFVPASPNVKLRESMIDGKTLRGGARRPGTPRGGPSIGLQDGAFVLEFSMKAEGKSVTVSLSVEPKVRTDLDIGSSNAHTVSELTNLFKLESTLKIDAAGFKFERDMDLGTVKFKCVRVMAGPVPVIICPEVKFTWSATIEGKLGTAIKVSYAREIGSRVETNNDQVSATSINREAGDNGVKVTPYAAISLSTGPASRLTLWFYKITGPSVRVELLTEMSADTFADPWWKVELGVNVGVGFHGKLFRWKFNFTKDDLLTFKATLAEADGPFRGLFVEDYPDQLELGDPYQFVADVRGYPDADATWRLLNGVGTISSSGLFSSSEQGEALLEATVPGDIGRPPLATRIEVRVGPGDPWPPTNVTATTAPLGANVSWQPGADGGSPITSFAITTTPATGVRYASATTRSLRLHDLDPARAYTITVYAMNSHGVSLASRSSLPITPLEGVVRIGSETNIAVTASGQPDSTGRAGDAGVALSGTARYAFFSVTAGSNLAPPEIFRPGSDEVFIVRKDLETGLIELATRGLDGVTPEPAGRAAMFDINEDGGVIAFWVSIAANDHRTYVHNINERRTWVASPRGVLPEGGIQLTNAGDAVFYVETEDAQRYTRSVYRSTAADGERLVITHEDAAGGFSVSGDGRKLGFQVTNIFTPDPLNWATKGRILDVNTGSILELPLAAGLRGAMAPWLSRDGSTYATEVQTEGPDPGSSAGRHWWVVVRSAASGPIQLAEVFAKSVATGGSFGPNWGPDIFDFSDSGGMLALATLGGEFAPSRGAYRVTQTRAMTALPTSTADYDDHHINLSHDGRVIAWSRRCRAAACVGAGAVLAQRLG